MMYVKIRSAPTFLFFLIMLIALPAFGASPPTLTLPWTTPTTLDKADDGLLDKVLKQGNVVSSGPLQNYRSKMVATGGNKYVALGDVAEAAFAAQQSFATSALNAPRGALFGRLKIQDLVVELPDAYTLVKRTEITIADPAALAASSPDWATYLSAADTDNRDYTGPWGQRQTLDAEQEKAIAEFLDKDAKTLPNGHPLKEAAAKGRDALLLALSQGKGDLVITDTFLVPKSKNLSAAVKTPSFTAPSAVKLAPTQRSLTKFKPTGIATTPAANVQVPDIASPLDISNMLTLNLPEFVEMKVEDLRFAGQPVVAAPSEPEGQDEMRTRNTALLGNAPAALRLMKIEGTLADYRIASVGAGSRFVTTRDDGRMMVNASSEDDATRYRLLRSGDRYHIYDIDNDQYVFVDGEGTLYAKATQRSGCPTFSIRETRWQPTLKVWMRAGGGQSTDALPNVNVTLRIESAAGNVRTQRVPMGGGFSESADVNLRRGDRVEVTPDSDEHIFSPSSFVVDAVQNHSLKFEAFSKRNRAGVRNFSKGLLAGFTIADGWDWDRKWEYTSGYFRIEAGVGYGFGLRFPIQVSGTLSPTVIQIAGTSELNENFGATLSARAFNANAAFYREVGLPEREVFDGKEFVMEANAYFTVKFRALWKTWVNKTWEKTKGFSEHWTPPWENPSNIGRLKIPAEITGTVLDYGVLRGEVESAFSLRANNPVVTLNTRGLPAGTYVNRQTSLQLTPQRGGRKGGSVGGRLNVGDSRSFGVEVFAHQSDLYHFDVELVPELRFSITARADYYFDDFRRTFRSPWFALEPFAINLGTVHFGHHDNTRNSFQVTGEAVRLQ